MAATETPQSARQPAAAVQKPTLVFFHSPRSGRCRRAEGFLAQVLQRRQNHETFRLQRVDADARSDIAERLRVTVLPTLLVVEGKVVRGRLDNLRGCREIADFLQPWLK